MSIICYTIVCINWIPWITENYAYKHYNSDTLFTKQSETSKNYEITISFTG